MDDGCDVASVVVFPQDAQSFLYALIGSDIDGYVDTVGGWRRNGSI
jgi:hypothetical protein